MVKDNRTLSKLERDLEREREQYAREDKERSRHRPSASRAVARVKGMRRAAGLGSLNRPTHRVARNRPLKPAPQPAALREYARRSFVRVRYAANKSAGQWAAHAKYLEREGAQKEGLQGIGFDARSDAVSLSAAASAWQRAGDERLFKLVLSPEDGKQMDLIAYTRRFMADVERQAGQPLEWAAIDHRNTDNPHVHILLRGNVTLEPQLVRSGMRTIAENQATAMLGYKSEQEKRRELDRDITARRFTQLDRLIQSKAKELPGGGHVVTESSLTRIQRAGRPQAQREEEIRLKRIARLQELEKLGVAEKIGAMTWKLEDNWSSALKQLEVLRTRSTMLLQHRELMTDPRVLPQVTKLQPGESLVGRALGGGLDETTDRRYLLVEGADGRAHFIDRADDAASVRPGTLVRVEGFTTKAGRPGVAVREYDLVIPASGFARAMQEGRDAVEKAAQDEIAARERRGTQQIERATATAGFAAHMQRALVVELEKAREKKRKKTVQRDAAGLSLERKLGE